VHEELLAAAALPMRGPDSPPIPFILDGWWASSAAQKHRRWQDTVQWAERRGLKHITSSVAADQFEHWSEETAGWNPEDDARETDRP
jgi:hypothetical protein